MATNYQAIKVQVHRVLVYLGMICNLQTCYLKTVFCGAISSLARIFFVQQPTQTNGYLDGDNPFTS